MAVPSWPCPETETGSAEPWGCSCAALGAAQEATRTLHFLPLRPLEPDPRSLRGISAHSLAVRPQEGLPAKLPGAAGCPVPCESSGVPVPLAASRAEPCLSLAAPAPAGSHLCSRGSRGAASSPDAWLNYIYFKNS